MPIYGDIIETDTIEAMAHLEARKHVSNVTLLPNANLGSDGLIRGCVVDVNGGISPQLIGNHASRSYVAVKTELKGAESIVNADIANMILSNIMPANCRLIEVGIDNCNCIWVLSVMDGEELNIGNEMRYLGFDSDGYNKVLDITEKWNNHDELNNNIIQSLFGDYKVINKISEAANYLAYDYDRGVFSHCRNASIFGDDGYDKGIILGSQSSGFGIVEGTGYYPTNCGTHLNREFAMGTMDKQVHDIEYGGVMSNANYYESPSRYRNLDNILDGLPDVRFVKKVQPLISIKQGVL